MIDQNGNHTVARPFGDADTIPSQLENGPEERETAISLADAWGLMGKKSELPCLMLPCNDLKPGVANLGLIVAPSNEYPMQMTADGRIMYLIDGTDDGSLVRLANPDGLPLRQRIIVWGTPGNPERLVWDPL